MALASATQCHLFGTVSAGDQKPAIRVGETSSQMEQKTDRSGVCPLDVVQDQQQRLFLGYGAQHIGDLLEELALFHVLRTSRRNYV